MEQTVEQNAVNRGFVWDLPVRGFTLMEVVIVLAVVAILAAIITPLVVGNIEQASIARAASDTKAVGEGIVKFHNDLGVWPMFTAYDAGARTSSAPVELLLGPGDIPSHTGAGLTWNRASRQLFQDNLTANSLGYPAGNADRARGVPVWNGPYVDVSVSDPWGGAYMFNAAYLDGGTAPNAAVVIYVLSAGPDRATDTPFNPAGITGDDDIAFRVR